MSGRTEWPPYREFQRAGRKALRDNITHNGGARRWAEEIGVRYVEHRPGHAPIWTEERIREELERFCAGREVWPTEREFMAAGRRALYAAASRNGGVAWCAHQLGLARRRPRT
jgi:hypothetical protein